MDINQFLNDATTVMKNIGSLATATLSVGTAIGNVWNQGKQVIAVLIAPFKPQSVKPTPSAASNADVAPVDKAELTITKPNVAIIVDIKQRSLVDVGHYLARSNIDADLIVISNDPHYGDEARPLDPTKPEEWKAIAREFNSVVQRIKRTAGNVQLHIFLSTPVALAMALGSLMGTVNEGALIYHWESGDYKPVVSISRELWQ